MLQSVRRAAAQISMAVAYPEPLGGFDAVVCVVEEAGTRHKYTGAVELLCSLACLTPHSWPAQELP